MTVSGAKTVYVRQSREYDGGGDKFHYLVTKTLNTVSPHVGDSLSEKDVTDLIRRKYKVNVS